MADSPESHTQRTVCPSARHYRRTGVIFDPAVQTCIFDHDWKGSGRADRRRLSDTHNALVPPGDSFAQEQQHPAPSSSQDRSAEVAQLKAEMAALEAENSRLKHEATQQNLMRAAQRELEVTLRSAEAAQLKAEMAALEAENSRLKHEATQQNLMRAAQRELEVTLAALSAAREDGRCGGN
jgi:predicted RNase H-like nuclease (RuvC/YqgF family)